MKNIEASFNIENLDDPLEEKSKKNVSDSEIETDNDFRKLVYDFMDQKAEGRNFEICYKIENDEIIIILKNKNREIVDFSEYIPNGYTLVPAERFECNIVSKKIFFDPKQVSKKGFLFSLTHELGHAKLDKIQDHFDINFFKQIGTLLINQIREVIKLKVEMKKNSQKEKRDRLKKEIYSKPAEFFIPLKYIEYESKRKAKSERNAWAESLRILRKLDMNGFNVFDEFESVEEIRAHIASCLFTHEVANNDREKNSIGGEEKQEHKLNFIRQKDFKIVKNYLQKN